jgi:hypothetical protein
VLDGEQAYTLEVPFCPHRGIVLLFTPPGKKAQVKFKVSDVQYDCDLCEVLVEGEILPEEG